MKSNRWFLPGLFGTTLFLSASLLFIVQPFVGKLLLPLLGGTSAVWNTCMVFFQALLLCGYLYSHLLGSARRAAAPIHLAVLLLPLFFLPIARPEMALAGSTSSPVLGLLLTLCVTVGAPFFVVATAAPLLQRFFSLTRHPWAEDPYFLYGASNAGSFLALLGYPFFIEPFFTLKQQGQIWAVGYGLLVVLTAACFYFASRDRKQEKELRKSPKTRLAPREVGIWIALSWIPVSLMLGLTTYLTTDIAPIPLLWVVPLAIYVATFVFAFSRIQGLVGAIEKVFPVAVVVWLFLTLSRIELPVWTSMPIHLTVFFLAAALCHGRLAELRPHPSKLTAYFLYVAVGGVLGGLFNAILAPVLFTNIIEYPLAMVAACVFVPWSYSLLKRKKQHWHKDAAVALGVGALTFAILSVGQSLGVMFLYGIPAVACYLMKYKPMRQGFTVAAVLIAGSFWDLVNTRPLYQDRSFYGNVNVRVDPTSNRTILLHGSTMHGIQNRDLASKCEPLAYFHRRGPAGDIFAASLATPKNVGIVGLGIGTLMAYAKPGQNFTFFEIDPAVEKVAMQQPHFSYLGECMAKGSTFDVQMGDARLKLASTPDNHFGLFVVDAFNSDAIPVHLLTLEAIRLYVSKLVPDGILAFNISSRCVDLQPVLTSAASELGLTALFRDDEEESAVGKLGSTWAVLTRNQDTVARLTASGKWKPAPLRKVALWTDDYSNLAGALNWSCL